MPELEIGDVVRLRSGGPKMTVQQRTSPGTLNCTWFLEEELKRSSFTEDSLEKVEDEEGSEKS